MNGGKNIKLIAFILQILQSVTWSLPMKLTRRSDSQLPLILPHISTYNYELYSTGKNEYTLNVYLGNCSSRDEIITLDDYIDITGSSYTYHEDYVEFKDEVKATHVTVKYKADGKGYNAKFTIELGRRIGCLKPEVLKSGAG